MKIQQQSFAIVLKSRCSEKFHKFHWKTTALVFLFNKAEGPQPCNFIEKRLQHKCFPVKFVKFFRASFSTVHLEYVLFKISSDKNLFKDLLAISCTSKSLITCYIHNDKPIWKCIHLPKFAPIDRFYNDLEQISFLLISTLLFFCTSK